MLKTEFKIELGRLVKAANCKMISKDKAKSLFETYGDLELSVFQRAINKLSLVSGYFPGQAAFEKLLSQDLIESRKLKEKKSIIEGGNCKLCNNTGAVYYRHIETSEQQAFQCTCGLGVLRLPLNDPHSIEKYPNYITTNDWFLRKQQ